MLFAALPTWPRRLLKGVLGLVLALLVILLITWIALPLWIERQGVRLASEQLGRPVTLTAAHFSPWRLALSLEGLRIAGPTADAPALLEIRRVDVAVSPRSLVHLAPVLSAVRVDGPAVHLALLGDGRTDIDDILARLASHSTPAPAEPAKEPDVAVYNIELNQGDIQLDDRQAGMVHHLSGLQLGIPFVSTLDADVEVNVQPRLSGQLNGIAFQTEAQAQPFAETRSASLQFKLDGLDLSAYRAYWPRQLPMRLASGLVDAKLTLDFRQPLQQPPELKLSGQADVRDLALQRHAGDTPAAGDASSQGWEDWLRWKQLSVDLGDVQPLRKQVLLNRVSLQGPELRLSRDAQGRLWLPVEGDATGAAAAAPAVAASSGRSTAPVARAPAAAGRASSAPRRDRLELSVADAGAGAAMPSSASSASAGGAPTGAASVGPSASPASAVVAAAPAKASVPASSASQATAVAAASAPWRVGVRQLEVAEGRVWWQDASVPSTAQWRVDGLTIKSSGLAWPLAAPAAPVEMSATFAAVGAAPAATKAAPAKTSSKTQTSASLNDTQVAAAKPAAANPSATAKTSTPAKPAAQTKPTAPAKTIAPAEPAAATLHAKGQLGKDGVTLDWGMEQLSLAWLAPYVQQVTPLQLTGRLAVQGSVKAGAQGEDPRLGLHDLKLEGLQLIENRQPVVSLAELSLDKAELAPAAQQISLGRLTLREPQAQLARDAAGHWNWAAWMAGSTPADKAPARSSTSPAPANSSRAASSGSPSSGAASAWRAHLAELVIDGGQVQLLDRFTHVLDDEPPRPIGVQDLSLRIGALDWDGQQLRQAVPLKLSLQARRPDVTRRINRDPPRLQWDGQIAMAPLRVNGKLVAEHLPLHWADPYLDPSIGIHLQRAEGNFKGDVHLAMQPSGPRVQATGDLMLSDLRLRQARLQDGRRRSAEDLLSWQALKLNGFKLQLAPAGVPDIAIRQASLDEFYARLIINEQGRLNLRDLRQTEQGQAVAAVAGTPAASAPVAATVVAATSSPAPASAAAAAPAASGPPLRLSIAETRVNAGQVDFTDRFIKPNYSAKLTELTGTLGSFSAGSEAMAPLQLKGRVAGTGLLDINGQLNPSGAPLALDITASATDIELAPLSPYAGKYAGYAIERGKLSTRVHYQIDPSGRLVADNKIVLNQLSFGDRIDSPDATKLPVRLAVALLKDSNGVIDLNLPVSGSINDPEFSVGSVVVKLIVNLLTKALTAPFSLFSGGGGADMSQLDFAPGTAALPTATAQRLDAVAKVLNEKPSLQVSITGWVDVAGERRAAQAARLEEAMLTERRRELRRQQDPAAAADAASAPAALVLDDAQRERLLKTVYDNAKLPNKPRNLIGMAKDIPAAQMREMLMDSYTVTDEQMRELALQRSVAVRDGLIARGVPNARMFLASPKLREGSGSGEGGKPWQPKVDLALSTQ